MRKMSLTGAPARLFSRFLKKMGFVREKKKRGYFCNIISVGKRADKIMSEKMLFLNPAFTMEQLARESGTNRTYISIYVRSEKGCCFREYIGRYRIEYACELISSGKANTLADAAMLSGFGCVRSFKSAYRAIYGNSPMELIKSRRRSA